MSRLTAWYRGSLKGYVERRRWRAGVDSRPYWRRAVDRLNGEPGIVHFFGDSQTNSYLTLPNSVVRLLAGITMHRVGRDRAWFMNEVAWRVGSRAMLMFVFGGVDARVHIGRVAELKGWSVAQVVDDVVERYLTAIESFRRGREVVVLGILPPGSNEEIGRRPRPTWGTQEARAEIITFLNRTLKDGCERRKFRFVDVGAPYADGRGFMPSGVTQDGIHLRPETAGPARSAVLEALAAIRTTKKPS
jgi:hypothetical protein